MDKTVYGPGMLHTKVKISRQAQQMIEPGDYRFVDQTYQSQYAAENRVASLSVWFAALAIVVSCLGLFGLASYSAERRIKEIGIRKVLGSTAAGIVFLLCKDFIRLVLISVVISIPISYYLLNDWLSNFIYAINLEWWVFIVAGNFTTNCPNYDGKPGS